VTLEETGGLAQLWDDKNGSTPKGNPFLSDSDGFAFFYVNPGIYRIDATLGGFSAVWRDVEIGAGNRYDIPFSATGEFMANEELPAFTLVVPLTLPVGLFGSKAFCDVAPTSEVVITFKTKRGDDPWTDAFTVTFAAGEIEGTFTMATELELAIDDRLRPVMDTSDVSFEGLAVTIAATSH
jgi:hypothetical protein